MARRWYAASLVFALTTAPLVQADDAAAIDYRKSVMRTLGEQVQALSMVAQGKAPAGNLKLHTEALALTGGQALKAFEPRAEGGHAKAEVWKNWKDFSERMEQLTTNLAQLDKSAKAGGVAGVAPRMAELLTCQGCHDNYRAPLSPAKEKPVQSAAILYRQHVMNSIDAQSAALGQILSTEIPDTNLTSHLEVLALIAAGSLKAFEPKAPGGASKPQVWDQWPDFSKRMDEFAHKTAAAAETARQQGVDAALPGIMAALSCKGCHDVYRQMR